jgi:hypothetical protein
VNQLQTTYTETQRDFKALVGHLSVGDFQALPGKVSDLLVQLSTDKAVLRGAIQQVRNAYEKEVQTLREDFVTLQAQFAKFLS